MLMPHKHRPEIYERLQAAFEAPSIYDESIALVARHGFDLPDAFAEARFLTEPRLQRRVVQCLDANLPGT